ncbi:MULTISPECIES: DUF5753 domain-containing protein [Thermomonosporaceae]|uniref:DUF5753 domain-containing protein n=1 Tax=Thermomonosporaceae TaxID=2012 RepID=UPI00255A8770|nr:MULTISPECIES: DUF5753 domain-containing protein [Thermomonosporaceae]MDL4774849.1 DUF5753 domain-containing protein [Actinomadura xylanilytica]
MATNPSPNPKTSMWDFIAFYLRFQRNHRGLSGESLGQMINASKATVSRLENNVERLDGTRAAVIDKRWKTGGLFSLLVWYASIGHDPQWYGQYVDFEQRARMIRIFEPLLVPGLFQTEEYAWALLAAGGEPNPEQVLTERMQRKTVLDRAFVTAILSEAVLSWPVGSPQIMRAQHEQLLELSERPNVTIHVVPRSFDTGAYRGLDGAMKLLTGPGFGELAYTESLGSGRLVSSPEDVSEFGIIYARISAKALPEVPSRNLIKKSMEAFSDDLA